MRKQGRTQLALGIILILLGAWFIAQRTFPEVAAFAERFSSGSLSVVGVGVLLLVLGLILGAPGLAVPAAIVSGIGGILYYQDLTGDSSTWSFMWTLIIGFVGIGVILQGLLGENTRQNLRHGLNLMVVSAVLFLVFSAFLGGWNILGNFGPAILLILLGLWVLGSGLFRSIRGREREEE
jgi:cytochrome bd-type quinol oxidase subunit 2